MLAHTASTPSADHTTATISASGFGWDWSHAITGSS